MSYYGSNMGYTEENLNVSANKGICYPCALHYLDKEIQQGLWYNGKCCECYHIKSVVKYDKEKRQIQ